MGVIIGTSLGASRRAYGDAVGFEAPNYIYLLWGGIVKNRYEVRGDVTAIFLKSAKYGKKETVISTEKLPKVKSFSGTWSLKWNRNNNAFYCQGHIRGRGENRTIQLQRLITDCPADKVVDHIDNNGLNNKDDNLRIVTNGENGQNRKGAPKNSKTGIRGVCWCKREQKWRASIKINMKHKHLGYFENIKEAEKTVINARIEHMPYSNENAI